MAAPNTFLNLPCPAGNGAGASVNVSAMGAPKSIVVSDHANCLIEIQTSNDNVNWHGLVTFSSSSQGIQTVSRACIWMRAVVSAYAKGTPVANVGSTSDGTLLTVLTVPPGSGSGAPSSTGGLPIYSTIQVGGSFKGALFIEVSEDGNTEWATIASFHGPDVETVPILIAEFMRVTRGDNSSGTPTVVVASTNPPGGSSGIPVIEVPLQALVYRPGATGVEAPGGNVFTTWPPLQTAIDQTKYLGYRKLEWDNRFAPPSPTQPPAVPPALNPCLIPAPSVPGTFYDMRDVVWVDRLLPPAGANMGVEIQDGVSIRNLKKIDMLLLNLVYNGLTVGNYPFIASLNAAPGVSYGWVHMGARLRVYNTVVGAQPMILFDIAGNNGFLDLQDNAAIGNGVVLPAPVIELGGGVTITIIAEGPTQLYNNAFKGPVGSAIAVQLAGSGAFEPLSAANQGFVNPAFAGSWTITNEILTQRWAPSAIATGIATVAAYGQVQQVNAAAPVTITLPPSKLTAPSTGTFGYAGSAITVAEVGGGASNITVAAPAGETINGAATFVMSAGAYQSARFWTPGTTGVWFVIA